MCGVFPNGGYSPFCPFWPGVRANGIWKTQCVDLNNWSRALYYYIAASCHLAIYRQLVPSDHPSSNTTTESQRKLRDHHATKAESLYRQVPAHVGKKRIIGRQLPVDVFVNRKIQKWEARQKEFGCEFVDAIGVSPIEEVIFFWNGYRRMPEKVLEESLRALAWSEEQEGWGREGLDERGILALLRAAVLRNLRRHDEAMQILKTEVLAHDRAGFKGHLRDDWMPPTAHYEMAVNHWMQRSEYIWQRGAGAPQEGTKPAVVDAGGLPRESDLLEKEDEVDVEHDRKLVREAKDWIEKAAAWEKDDLGARIGLKVTTAGEAVRRWEGRYGPVR